MGSRLVASDVESPFSEGNRLQLRPRTLLLVAAVTTLAYLAFAPVPVAPVAWQPTRDAGYVGPHATNTRLAALHQLPLGNDEGPEHVAIDRDGRVYASVASGRILRLDAAHQRFEPWATTGGRPLGFDIDGSGRLIVADAVRGLLAVSKQGAVSVLLDRVDGQPLLYANSVVVGRSGRIYLTDASQRFAPPLWGGTFEASILDILEHSATGRVLAFDPASGAARVVMRGLSFANGVALSADEERLFVAETGEYRVWSVDVTASNVDARHPDDDARVIVGNLPGYPDNLTRGRDGRTWLGLAKPRSALVDWMADKPFFRQMTLRLPRRLWPVPRPHGHVVAFDDTGRIVADLQDPTGSYPETTGVTETADRLYIQSLHARTLGWLPSPY